MNLETLKGKVRTAKLHPVHVDDSALGDDVRGHTFIGGLEEYFEAVRAIGTSIILISTETLDEDWFSYALAVDDETSRDESESIDLCAITPELRKFKAHLGEIAMYKLSAALGGGNLNFFVDEAWWLEFKELWRSSVDKVDNDQAASDAQSKADQIVRDREALTALSKLIGDPNFVRLPTQKAMIAYAVDRIPELQAVNQNTLRAEVQDIHAKIKAKGLGRIRT